MIKLTRLFALILAAVVLFSGCDRIRSMMGKPTSSDLERLRVEKEAQEKALRDSIARAEEALAIDSAAVSTPEKPVAAKPAGKPATKAPAPAAMTPAVPTSTGNLPRYSVIVGSYVKEYNVRAMTRRMEKLGETVTVIPFKSGFTGVAVFTTNDFAEARAKRKQMLASGAVPSDTWIYDTTWGRHK